MTATTSTLSGPSTARRGPALWAGLAFLLGGAVMGATATMVIDTNDSPARSATSVDASFRSASAAEAERYVESLESNASVYSQPGAYAHGFSYAPESAPVSVNQAERWALSEGSASNESCHNVTRGVC